MIEGEVVRQRARDGYINATAMCKAAGKLWGNYHQNEGSQAFLMELEADIGIPISELVQSVRGGFPDLQGTWVHPYVAVHLAQWLSPRFAVRVSQWVHEWMTQGPRGKAELPFHLRRYLANYNNVPIDRGATLPEVQETLGHDNIATTSGYLHARPDSSSGLRLDPGIFRQPEDQAAE
jgi:hypothetical protein